jgi:hypothetical protein
LTATIVEPTPVDFDRYYTCKGWGGVAFWLRGYAQIVTNPDVELACDDEDCDHDEWFCWSMPDPFEADDLERVRATMVGDDGVHIIDVEDLIPLSREEFCGECGQVGCTHDGLDRD